MSKIKDIINKKVAEYKLEGQFIENLDLGKEVLHFFEESLIPLILSSKDFRFTLTSKMLVNLFTEVMNAKYDSEFTCFDPNRMYDKISRILEIYAKEDECLHVLLLESDPEFNPQETDKGVIIYLDKKVLYR